MINVLKWFDYFDQIQKLITLMISRIPTKSPNRRIMAPSMNQASFSQAIIQENQTKEINYELIAQKQEEKKEIQQDIADLRRTLKSNEKQVNYEQIHMIQEEKQEREAIKASMMQMNKEQFFAENKWRRYKQLTINQKVRKLYQQFKAQVQGINIPELKQLNTQLLSLYQQKLQQLENQMIMLLRGQEIQESNSLEQKIQEIQQKIDEQDINYEKQELSIQKILSLIGQTEQVLTKQRIQLSFKILGNHLQLQDATDLMQKLMGLSYTQQQIQQVARDCLEQPSEPLRISQQDLQTIYQITSRKTPFLLYINEFRLYIEALKYFIMYYDYDQIDKVPQDRGSDNMITFTVGELREKYNNEISVVGCKKNYKYEHNLIISFELEDSIEVNEQFCNNFKQKLLEVVKMGAGLLGGEESIENLLKMLRIEVTTGNVHQLIIKVDVRGYEIEELEELINSFTDKIFFNYSEFSIEAKFEFQKNLFQFFNQQINDEKQIPQSTGFLSKNAKFTFKLEINEVISIIKQIAKSLTVFDDLQYKPYAPSSLIPLILLSTESTSTQFEFENYEPSEEKQTNEDDEYDGQDFIENKEQMNRKIKKKQEFILGLLKSFIEMKKELEGNIEIIKILDDIKSITLEIAIGTLNLKAKLRIQDLDKIMQIQQ